MPAMFTWLLRCTAVLAVLAAVAGCGPTGTDALTQQAVREYDKGNLDQAHSHLQRALAFEPSDAQALLCMGKVNHAQGKLEMALFYYQSAIDADPSNKQAQACLLQVQGELGPTGKNLQIIPSPQDAQP